MNVRSPSLAVASLVTVALLLAACQSAGPSSSPAPAGTGSGTGGGATAGPKVAPPAIKVAGKLQFCSDMTAPPLEFLDAQQQPQGSDIEIGVAIAGQLGLEPVWKQTQFSGIIPALIAGHCDAILSQVFVKPERERVVDFIPYMYSGQSILVKQGNPKSVDGLTESLCGKRVSTTTATTAHKNVEDLSKTCVAGGKQAITITIFPNDIAALQQLALGRSDAYATTSETAAYYMGQQPNTYEFAGKPWGRILTGIPVKKGNEVLRAAIADAFGAIRQNGTYHTIMQKWNLVLDELDQ